MIDLNTIHDAIAQQLDQAKASRNAANLTNLQTIAGFLMKPADMNNDRDTTYKFRVLAAKAANLREELNRRQRGDDED